MMRLSSMGRHDRGVGPWVLPQQHETRHTAASGWRHALLLCLVCLAFVALAWRALMLQVFDNHFLRDQGDARALRTLTIPAHRGMIMDRRGEPLAISTPVASVWANPQVLGEHSQDLARLAAVLRVKAGDLQRRVKEGYSREFLYLRRHVSPDVAVEVERLQIPGVFLMREYRRYYPAGEVTAHVLGFTDVDDEGQEGLELAYNAHLRGEAGAHRVLQDRRGTVVEPIEWLSPPRPGRDLAASLDLRLQYLLYRELKAAVLEHGARGGSAVLLDAASGEILAMANQPAANPNDRRSIRGSAYRNRAVTDLFEPGSTVKPFTVACGLESGRYRPDTRVDTHPGLLRVGRKTIHDVHDYGILDVAGIIQKSSNVGASRIALSLPPQRLWDLFARVGFGSSSGSAFPGEPEGRLRNFAAWRTIDQATLAFGYGLSVTPLQLARAYAVLASDGIRRDTTFLRVDHPPAGARVLRAGTVVQVRRMLEAVTREGGTATRAAVPGYRTAGKTGTVRKLGENGLYSNRYLAAFAGMAPASRPRLVLVVVVDDPRRGGYYGGLVAAPVFGRVMPEALRLLDIPPDDLTPSRTAEGLIAARIKGMTAQLVSGGNVTEDGRRRSESIRVALQEVRP